MRSTALARGGFLVTMLLLAACGSSPATSPTGPGSTAAAHSTPTAAPVAAGAECAGLPVYNPASPSASFAYASDKTIEAKFPTQIDGQPVTGITSGRFIEMLCYFDGQAGIDALRTSMPVALNLMNMSVGSAQATVDGASVIVSAFRTPGADAGQLLQDLASLASSSGSDTAKFTLSELKDATVGGKAVKTWTDATGNTSYIYVTGDTIIMIDSVTPSQAEKIFTAMS